MSRRLSLLAIILVSVLLMPSGASAHVLVRDQAGGAGAIMHVMPDDDPVAGEGATIFFDIRDNSVAPELLQATLTITDERGATANVPIHISGSGVSAQYIFPRQELYKIQLVIKQDDQTLHTFSQSQRVSRGTAGDANTGNVPAWAQIGAMATALAIVLLAITAFNRRQSISRYSKL